MNAWHLFSIGIIRKTKFLPASTLEQLHLFDTGPLSQEERQRVLVQAGLRAGWDDPEIDVYNSI
jgi:hypothetical protein